MQSEFIPLDEKQGCRFGEDFIGSLSKIFFSGQ